MGRLDGKVALITGAGTGIGRAAARLFSSEGARVAIAELNPDLGKETARLLREARGDALFVETDVTDEASVKRAVRETVGSYGKLDVLYNCAGGSVPEDTSVTEVDLRVFDHTIGLDLKGTLLCCRHAVPEMIKAGRGSIVNMSSAAALQGTAMHVYSAAKGAIISLTRSLASAYTEHGIRVNAICPGLVLTDRIQARFGTLPELGGDADSFAARTASRYPFAVGQPEDIAHVALFLASDVSRMVNAAIVPAEGGMSAF